MENGRGKRCKGNLHRCVASSNSGLGLLILGCYMGMNKKEEVDSGDGSVPEGTCPSA